jgi:hypothetical protein
MMRQLEAALRQLAEHAEPLPTEVLIARVETELGWAPSAVAEREEPIMVTRQQSDIETPTPPPRPRRGPLVAATVAVVVILAGVGIAFATGAFESESDTAADRLDVATELVDTWNQGWEDEDPELVVSVFTDDGVYIVREVGLAVDTVTKDDMVSYVLTNPRVHNADRIGELTQSGDGTYTWVEEFDALTARFGGELEIELEGDLAKRIEWLDHYERIGPASDS